MSKLKELKNNGCCVIENALSANLISKCINFSEKALSNLSQEHREKNKSQGSMIHLADHPNFSELIASDDLLNALNNNFDFTDLRFSSGYLISKPPKSPPLFWHQDWWGWEHKSSYTDFMHQIFVMIYLTDTTRENGCLKYLSGSHRKQHKFHDSKNAHSEELARVDNPDDPLFNNEENEIDVTTKLGDIVVGDARVLHAANKNNSDNKRSLITLWFHPHYNKMTDEMRSRIYHLYIRKEDGEVETDVGGISPLNWKDEHKNKINFLAPNIETAPPTPWQRKPNWN
jgi:ectoine hydroxylase-related dioxygenase (phytanoyl-CoA dioxygenase family)